MDEMTNIAIMKRKLHSELTRVVGDAGKIIYVRADDFITPPWSGKSWTVVFDTEYAALKSYYAYRGSDVHFGRSENFGGWYITVTNR